MNKIIKYHPLQWFIDRIGKKVYREDVKCDCHTCKRVTHEGLFIGDKFHAEYLHMVQFDLNIRYQDQPFNK